MKGQIKLFFSFFLFFFFVFCGDETQRIAKLPLFFESSGLQGRWLLFHPQEKAADPLSRLYAADSLKLSEAWLSQLRKEDFFLKWDPIRPAGKQFFQKGKLLYQNQEIYGAHLSHVTSSFFSQKPTHFGSLLTQLPGRFFFHLPSLLHHQNLKSPSFQKGSYSSDSVKHYLQNQYHIPLEQIHLRKTLWFPKGDHFEQSFLFHVGSCGDLSCEQGNWPHRIIASGVSGYPLLVSPLYLELDGKARLFPDHPRSNKEKIDAHLPYLLNGQQLEGEFWLVKNCLAQNDRNACVFRRKGEEGHFGEPNGLTDETYEEVLAYYAIGKNFQWQLQLQIDTESDWDAHTDSLGINRQDPMKIFVRTVATTLDAQGQPKSSYANAAYLPFGESGDSSPEIVVGTGWEEGLPEDNFTPEEKNLTYLGKDADVFIHEFNHHVIFKALNEIDSPETVSIHEGLADYMAYSLTNDNVLAEGVVNSSGGLRRGDLDNLTKYVFGYKPTLKDVFPSQRRLIYYAGEYLSAVLWEIREKMGLWKEGWYKFDYLSHLSLEFLPHDGQYYDLIAALALASDDYSLKQGEDPIFNRQIIFQVFYDYGYLKQPDSLGSLPEPSETLLRFGTEANLRNFYNSQLIHNQTESSHKKKKWYCCGTLANVDVVQEMKIMKLLLLLFLFFQLRRWKKFRMFS